MGQNFNNPENVEHRIGQGSPQFPSTWQKQLAPSFAKTQQYPWGEQLNSLTFLTPPYKPSLKSLFPCFNSRNDSRSVTTTRLCSMGFLFSIIYGQHGAQVWFLTLDHISDKYVAHFSGFTKTLITRIWDTKNPGEIQQNELQSEWLLYWGDVHATVCGFKLV